MSDTQNTGAREAIIKLLSEGCARLVRKPKNFKRDGFGQYPWAWTGDTILVRITPEQFERLEKMMDYADNIDIVVGGRLLGKAELWKPYAYPSLFLVLKLEEKYIDNPTAVLRFAQMAGCVVPGFDRALLTITRPDPNEHHELIF
jgi:hypothetical protein